MSPSDVSNQGKYFESRSTRATVTAKPSAYALQGHPFLHYIRGPDMLDMRYPVTPSRGEMTEKEAVSHETARSRPSDHDYGKPEAHPCHRWRRGDCRYHPCADPEGSELPGGPVCPAHGRQHGAARQDGADHALPLQGGCELFQHQCQRQEPREF